MPVFKLSKAEHDKVAAAAQRLKEPAATLLTAVAAYNDFFFFFRGTHWPMTLKISKSSSRTSRSLSLIDWTLSRPASFQLRRWHEISARVGEPVSES